jgi:ElaB/YqjD/DUF883 family membrane-anchored ribosome-binding protein
MQNGSDIGGARAQLVEDFGRIVRDSEELLRAVASVPGDKARELRASVESNLAGAKAKLRELQDAAYERGTAAVRATDEYAHENPWPLIGAAALIGLLVGVMLNSDRGRN